MGLIGNFKKRPALGVALVGIMAATLECGKLLLASLPNIEVVTLLLALYGYVFGILGVISSIIFVCIEPLIYGFGLWTVSYFLYWPLVPLLFWFLKCVGIKNRFVFTAVALVATAWFGVLSSLIDIGLFSGRFDNFWKRFAIYYLRGVTFYATQLICNAVLFLFAFKFLASKLEKTKKLLK